MDTFTVSTIDATQMNAPVEHKGPSKSFRIIFLLLLLATLASAAATTWILMGGLTPASTPAAPISTVPAAVENPFAVESQTANPFVDTAIASSESATNPFEDEETLLENPFAAFASTTVTTGNETNPF